VERVLEAHAPQRRISLGLDRVVAALRFYGRPDSAYPAVIISGTKGKGSTAAFLAQSLRAIGFKTGLYTSPHLQCIGERILVNNEMIPPKRLLSLIREVLTAIRRGKIPELSYFEVLTVVAARYFAESRAEFVVWEVGIGGRLDATNACSRAGSITTAIALDHTEILGPTLRDICREKLAVHEPSDLRIIGDQSRGVRRLLPEFLAPHSYWLYGRDFSAIPVAESASGATISYSGGGLTEVAEIRQAGRFQVANAANALAFIQRWRGEIPPAVLRALPSAFWPGRMELVKRGRGLVLLDGAHNTYSVQTLVKNLRRLYPGTFWTIIFAVQTTKDYPRMIQALCKVAREFVFTVPPGALKFASPAALVDVCRRPSRAVSFEEATGLYLPPAYTDPVLVTGSLYLVGAVRTALGIKPLTRDATED
jgi:dihydrofolate synthase/folylpolyglutamate synthase